VVPRKATVFVPEDENCGFFYLIIKFIKQREEILMKTDVKERQRKIEREINGRISLGGILRSRISAFAVSALLVLSLTGCALGKAPAEAGGKGGEAQEVKLGIIQYVEHPSLDSARQGLLDVLAENGYTEGNGLKVTYRNAQADMPIAQSIAQQFAEDKPDLILAIATPTAMVMANATKDIPILITAVTDPVDAKLVQSMEKPGTNVTGTSDYISIEEQILLVQKIVPGAQRLGLIYNNGEQNSVVQAQEVKNIAEKLKMQVVEATPNNSSEVLQAAQSLVGKVDAIFVPTDNTVVSGLEAVIKVANENNIPLFVGESDSVKRGALATIGVDYYELGRKTGEKALQVLEGVNPAAIPVETQSDYAISINLKAAQEMAVQVPDEIIRAAKEVYNE
jgi:putative ABC transport system substrate-binding protein